MDGRVQRNACFFQDFEGLTEVFAPRHPLGYPRGRPPDIRPKLRLWAAFPFLILGTPAMVEKGPSKKAHRLHSLRGAFQTLFGNLQGALPKGTARI